MLDLLFWPFAAGLVLTGIHAYLGMHVLARGIVFVDLSLAQVAALGIAVAILAGHAVQSAAAYWYALAFAAGGALLFALARRHEGALHQEAVIGIVYAVCAAMGVLALDRAPQGAEHIKQVLIGSILTVQPQEVGSLALLYLGVGAMHWLLRKPLLEVSFEPAAAIGKGRRMFVWDLLFYGSFALVVTSSVRIAGVLLVFSYLIVPAALAGFFAVTIRARLLLAWLMGATVTAAGLAASWVWDLPTGPAIVTAFGAATAVVALLAALRRVQWPLLGKIGSATVATIGALLVAFPQMDQPWLDALEDSIPQVQEAFLTPSERELRRDSLDSITRAQAELARLRLLEQDVRWGTAKIAYEPERLRQYMAARSEIEAGDQMVLKELRRQSRARQRWALGAPLLLLGLAGFVALSRRRRPPVVG